MAIRFEAVESMEHFQWLTDAGHGTLSTGTVVKVGFPALATCPAVDGRTRYEIQAMKGEPAEALPYLVGRAVRRTADSIGSAREEANWPVVKHVNATLL